MKQLPGHYVLSKFYTYAGEPTFRKFDGNYNASCNICREGKSWLKKKRLFFYPSTNSFYCFHCGDGKSWNARTYIQLSSGLSKEEIEQEAFTGDISIELDINRNTPIVRKEKPSLPYDSININDKQQQDYYKNNSNFIKVLEYIDQRRINTAINKCKNFYISFTDSFHKNRLCIPFYDRSGKISFYQTRALDGSDPRYLNKVGYEKTIFGIDRIDTQLEYIFIFEGPIDSMFVKNGVCLAGLELTSTQEKQLSEFAFHEKIWVLDNPKKDQAAKEKIHRLLMQKQKVFRWPSDNPFKDFNEWVVKEGIDEIPYDLILNSLFQI